MKLITQSGVPFPYGGEEIAINRNFEGKWEVFVGTGANEVKAATYDRHEQALEAANGVLDALRDGQAAYQF